VKHDGLIYFVHSKAPFEVIDDILHRLGNMSVAIARILCARNWKVWFFLHPIVVCEHITQIPAALSEMLQSKKPPTSPMAWRRQILQKCSGKGPSSVHFMNMFSRSWVQRQIFGSTPYTNKSWGYQPWHSHASLSDFQCCRIFDRNKKVNKKMVIRFIERLSRSRTFHLKI
jgi:hypothetical protein